MSLRKIVFNLVVLMCILLGVILPSCKGKITEEEPPVRPVKLLTLDESGLYRYLEFPGDIRAFQDAKVSFLVAGRIISIPVLRGQEVKKGQILAKLDPEDYQNRYNAAKAAANERMSYLKRIKYAVSKDVATKMELDEAQRQYDVAKAQMEIEKKALNDTVLRAEFEGQIGEKYKEIFQDVQAKEEIMRLQDISIIKIVVYVPESLRIISAEDSKEEIKKNTEDVYVTFRDIPNKKFNMKYFESDKSADPKTNTYAVTFIMKNPKGVNILPGMSATTKGRFLIKSSVEGETFFMVPVEAVFSDTNSDRYVWIQDPETKAVSKRKVTVGQMSGEKIEVLTGLKLGEVIATSGVHHLRDGMKVKSLVFESRREEG